MSLMDKKIENAVEINDDDLEVVTGGIAGADSRIARVNKNSDESNRIARVNQKNSAADGRIGKIQ